MRDHLAYCLRVERAALDFPGRERDDLAHRQQSLVDHALDGGWAGGELLDMLAASET
jgi:hypothetical protein